MNSFVIALLERPVEDPVLIVAIAMVVFLVAPLLLKRFRLPGIVGILLTGVVVGPNALNLLRRSETIVLLGTVGLIYLMFVAGLEIDINAFLDSPDRSVVFGLASFTLPFALGTLAGLYLFGFSLGSSALYASVFSSHTVLAYPIVDRLGIAKNNAVTTAISGTVLTDTLALLVLAVVTKTGEAGMFFWVRLVAGLGLLFAAVWLLVPRVGRWFFRNLEDESYFEFLFVMAVLFVSAFAAELVGVEAIIGAFFAGLALNRLINAPSTLMNRVGFVGNALFIPFFLLSVGMLVDPQAFLNTTTWLVAGVILAVLTVSKLAASWLTGAFYDYPVHERLTMFGLTMGQAAAALAITLIGFDRGLFGESVVNGVVLMILVVGVVSPYLSDRFGRDIVEAEEREGYEPGEAPQRILLPITSYTQNWERLLDLAMLVREPDSEEPIHVVTVVEKGSEAEVGGDEIREKYTELSGRGPGTSEGGDESGGERDLDEDTGDDAVAEDPEADDTEAEVAEAEEKLEETEEHAASAEVPVDTQTRVDANAVSGIARAVEENRISTVITEWSERARGGSRFGLGNYVFGSTTDRLLERTDELVLVSRLNGELNTVKRVVVVLPGRISYHSGVYEAVHTVKQLQSSLGVEMEVVVPEGGEERYGELIDSVVPETPYELEPTGWNEFYSREFEEDDFVVALSPRRGARGWNSRLGSMPRRLSGLDVGNVVVMYLAEDRDRYMRGRRFLRYG